MGKWSRDEEKRWGGTNRQEEKGDGNYTLYVQ